LDKSVYVEILVDKQILKEFISEKGFVENNKISYFNL